MAGDLGDRAEDLDLVGAVGSSQLAAQGVDQAAPRAAPLVDLAQALERLGVVREIEGRLVERDGGVVVADLASGLGHLEQSLGEGRRRLLMLALDDQHRVVGVAGGVVIAEPAADVGVGDPRVEVVGGDLEGGGQRAATALELAELDVAATGAVREQLAVRGVGTELLVTAHQELEDRRELGPLVVVPVALRERQRGADVRVVLGEGEGVQVDRPGVLVQLLGVDRGGLEGELGALGLRGREPRAGEQLGDLALVVLAAVDVDERLATRDPRRVEAQGFGVVPARFVEVAVALVELSDRLVVARLGADVRGHREGAGQRPGHPLAVTDSPAQLDHRLDHLERAGVFVDHVEVGARALRAHRVDAIEGLAHRAHVAGGDQVRAGDPQPQIARGLRAGSEGAGRDHVRLDHLVPQAGAVGQSIEIVGDPGRVGVDAETPRGGPAARPRRRRSAARRSRPTCGGARSARRHRRARSGPKAGRSRPPSRRRCGRWSRAGSSPADRRDLPRSVRPERRRRRCAPGWWRLR